MKKKYFTIVVILFVACAGRQPSVHRQAPLTMLSDEIKDEIRKVEKSIVGIGTIVKYEISRFEASDTGRKTSVNGKSILTVERDEKTVNGGGLIISSARDQSRFIILTSAHIVAPEDTIDVYYLDETGLPSNRLFSRSILKEVIITVRGASNWRAEAKLIALNTSVDLALLEVKTDNLLGVEFNNAVGYDSKLSWGDWVFLFGYPKGIKQLTGGWVSESPYPGTHSVDAVVRNGFSGGPVFALTSDSKLAFIGLIKSVPRSTIEYVAPGESMPMGYQLSPRALEHLVVKKQILVDYGTAYFVSPTTIRKFFADSRFLLEQSDTNLPDKYY